MSKKIQKIIFNINTKSRKMEKCYAPKIMKCDCDKKIVNAHTVSKSSNLSLISKNNHVYDFYLNPSYIFNDSPPTAKQNLKGINQASTFKIFCKKHDSELFKDFEDNPLSLNSKHLFLIHYRTITQELYKKEVTYTQYSKYIEKLENELDYQSITNIKRMKRGTGVAIRDMSIIKNTIDDDLINERYSEVKSFVILLDNPIDIMTSGAFNPNITFDNETIFDLNDHSKNAPLLSVNSLSFNENKQSIIVFSWIPKLDTDNTIGKFIDSLEKFNDKEIVPAVFNLIFKSIENIFISPNWLDAFSDFDQNIILKRITDISSSYYTLNDYKELKTFFSYVVNKRVKV